MKKKGNWIGISIVVVIMITAIISVFWVSNPMSNEDVSNEDEEVFFYTEITANVVDGITMSYELNNGYEEPTIAENLMDDFFIEELSELDDSLYTWGTVSEKEQKVIASAKEKVIEFIKETDYFVEKDNLIKDIENLQFRKFIDTTDPQYDVRRDTVIASHWKEEILINGCSEDDSFNEYVAVHEMIHYLRYATHGHTEVKQRYYGSLFDEMMTDYFAYSVKPENNIGVIGYSEYYFLLAGYNETFGDDAGIAFFYGYDELFTKWYENLMHEHDMYVNLIEYYYQGEEAACFYVNDILSLWKSKIA